MKTGARRPPRAGELVLSLAPPWEAYRVLSAGTVPRELMREATPGEERCSACGQALPCAEDA